MDTQAILAVRKKEPHMTPERPHLWPAILVVIALLGIAVAFLGTRTPTQVSVSPTPPEDAMRNARVYTISYRFGVFSPTNLRIHVGDTVRWKNDSPLPIRVIAQVQEGGKLPAFDSVGSIQPGGYYSNTFSLNGIFGYYNPSDANESGVIIVRE